jgi:hypothetical protein
MKKIVLIICMGLTLFTAPAQAVLVTVVEQGDTWNYAVLTTDLYPIWNSVSYSSFDWENATWLIGQAAFGTPCEGRIFYGQPCLPHNTFWLENTDLALTKTVLINGIFTDPLTLYAASDNGFIVFVNGTEVFRTNRSFYTEYWEYAISVNPSVFSWGLNTISVLAEDHGDVAFFDMELIGDLEYVPQPIGIDIKPGSDPNSINLKAKGVVPVAVLTTNDFDASTIDPATVFFAGASPKHWAIEDVDTDGDLDMILHFKTQELNLNEQSTTVTLIGLTYGGMPFQGTDSVNIVPSK